MYLYIYIYVCVQINVFLRHPSQLKTSRMDHTCKLTKNSDIWIAAASVHSFFDASRSFASVVPRDPPQH